MGLFEDIFDGMGDLGCVAAALFIIVAPVYYIGKLILKFIGWVSDSLGRLSERAFHEP